MTVPGVTTRSVIDRHLSARSSRGDPGRPGGRLHESVLITQDAVFRGPEEIREFFAELLSEGFRPGTYEFSLEILRVEKDTAYRVDRALRVASTWSWQPTRSCCAQSIAIQTFAAKRRPPAVR
ncbi:MAG: hypothetical protein U0Y82_08810 [Thermoleophilia bacterium]